MTDAALQRLSPRFDRLYCTIGRPSIPPEKLLRALLLQMLYSIRSERLLMEELDDDILYRWFVGLLDGDVADAFFTEVLAAIKADGLLSDEHFTVDGTRVRVVRTSTLAATARASSSSTGHASADIRCSSRTGSCTTSTLPGHPTGAAVGVERQVHQGKGWTVRRVAWHGEAVVYQR